MIESKSVKVAGMAVARNGVDMPEHRSEACAFTVNAAAGPVVYLQVRARDVGRGDSLASGMTVTIDPQGAAKWARALLEALGVRP